MEYRQWPKCDPVKNYFQLPNELFLPDLSPQCADRLTPICSTIDLSVLTLLQDYRQSGRMSQNTAHKYVCELEKRQLISTENTTVVTKGWVEAQQQSALYHLSDPVYARPVL